MRWHGGFRLSAFIAAVAVGVPVALVTATPSMAAPSITAVTSPRSFSPNGDGSEDSLSVGFRLGSAANVTAVVRDAKGDAVRILTTDQSYPGGTFYLDWDGMTTRVMSSLIRRSRSR